MVYNIPKLTLTGRRVKVTTAFHGQICPACPSVWQGQSGNSAAKLSKRFTDLLMLDKISSSTALKPKVTLEMFLKGIELYWEKNTQSVIRVPFFSTQEDGLHFWS